MIISEVFAFIAEDKGPTDEGIVALYSPDLGCLMPMIIDDERKIGKMIPVAKAIAEESGKRIRLFKFCCREEVVVINP